MKTNKLTVLSLEKQTITRLQSLTITGGNILLEEPDERFTGDVGNSCHSSYCD